MKISLEQIAKQVKEEQFRVVFVGDSITSIEWVHPNQLGNAYIAKIVLKELFGISFDSEKYIKDTKNSSIKYPSY